jgi:hypothetical protein
MKSALAREYVSLGMARRAWHTYRCVYTLRMLPIACVVVTGAGKGGRQRCGGAPGLADGLRGWASGKN